MENTKLKIDNMNVHYFRYPFNCFVRGQREQRENHVVLWASVPHLWIDQYGVEPHEGMFQLLASESIEVDAMVARPYNYTLFADRDSLAGRHSMTYYRNAIDLAAEQKIPVLGIELWGALRDVNRERQYDNCCRALRELCGYAGEKGLVLAVGNVSYGCSAMMNTLREIKKIMKDAGCDNLTAALDYGAAWLQGEYVLDWLDTFGERLSLIYLSDARNNGAGYPLSMGCCAIRRDLESLRKRHFSGVIALRMSQDFCQSDPLLTDRQNREYLDGNKLPEV